MTAAAQKAQELLARFAELDERWRELDTTPTPGDGPLQRPVIEGPLHPHFDY